MFATMVAIALALWAAVGPFTAPKITVEPHYTDAAYAGVTAVAGTVVDDPCLIILYPKFQWLTPEMQQTVIDHEVGHCLGLEHIDPSLGIMTSTAWGTEPTAADRAEFYRVHPMQRRGVVASLTSE
jgi:hypothetical protein